MLNGLRKTFKDSSLASVGFAALIAAMPFAASAQDNNAQQVNTTQTVAALPQVPFDTITGVETDAVKTAAAIQSKDAQVVVFFGVNPASGKAAYKALQEIIAEGSTAFKGMYIADPMEVARSSDGQVAFNSSEAIMIYADGQITDTIENPSVNVGKLIKKQLRSDYQDFIKPRRALASNDAAPHIAGLN